MVEEKNKKYLLLSLKGEKKPESALHLAKLRTKVIDSHRQRFRFCAILYVNGTRWS